MSDTDLHDLLIELSDQVFVPDLLPRVDAGVRARHRRRVGLAVLATIAVIATAAVAGRAVTSAGHQHPTDTIATPTPTPRPTPKLSTRAGSTTSVLPTYVPRGATLGHTGFVPYPAGLTPPPHYQRDRESWYRLAGRRNADTIPKGGANPSTIGSRDVHTGTSLNVMFVPEANVGDKRTLHDVLPPIGKHDTELQRVRVDVAGNRALISIDETEHGAFRIDWFDMDGYHTIGEDRVITPHGLSGVGRRALVRMARSLYS